MVKLFVERGADIGGAVDFYRTALNVALWASDADAVKLLSDAGADVSLRRGHYGNAL